MLSQLSFLIFLFLTLYYIGFQLFYVHLATDQSWYLYASRLILQGTKLYGPQLTETNPPLIIWVSAIPVYFASHLHLPSILCFQLFTFAFLAISGIWLYKLLKYSALFKSSIHRQLLMSALMFLILMIQPSQFGQREQLIVALILPYVIAISLGINEQLSLPQRILLGVCAAVAICLKPFHGFVIILFELTMAAYAKRLPRLLRAELAALAAAGTLYLILVKEICPQYFSDTVPLLAQTYWAFGRYTFIQMLFHDYVMLWATVVLFGLWYKVRTRLQAPRITICLLMCSFGAGLAYDLQHTGWGYQHFPETTLFWMSAAWMAIDLLDFFNINQDQPVEYPSPVAFIAILVASCFAVWITPYSIGRIHKTNDSSPSTLPALLARLPADTHVYIFSTNMEGIPPVLSDKLVWSSRFAHLWMLPAIVENEQGPADPTRRFKRLPAATVSALRALQLKDSEEDLSYWKPTYVLMATCETTYACPAIDRPFDVLGWFMQSPMFAREWSHYSHSEDIDGYAVFIRDH